MKILLQTAENNGQRREVECDSGQRNTLYSTPLALMSAAVSNAMEGVVETSQPIPEASASNAMDSTPTSAPEEPAVPVNASETLYIQNLNEKIKIDGDCLSY